MVRSVERIECDVIVVGGGPAGLSAALCLARYNRSVVVVDAGGGSSTHRQRNRNYVGFPDGVDARQLRDLGEEQLSRYPGARVVRERVARLEGSAEGGFTAAAGDTEVAGRAVVLATGVVHHFPRFPGWEEFVGVSMFWCVGCDGYEHRGRDVLVVGGTDAAAAEALQLQAFTDRVRLLTNEADDGIGPTFEQRLADRGVAVVRDVLARATGRDGRVECVETVGGLQLATDALFCVQGATPQNALATGLGVTTDADGYVLVDVEQRTDVPGVLAAGDLTSLHSHTVTAAVHEGATAASTVNHDLHPVELKAP
jgi:thioredoxin reductase (NADPH)